MAESKYKFERLTLNEDINLDSYEEAINYVFENPDIKMLQFLVHMVLLKVVYCISTPTILQAF